MPHLSCPRDTGRRDEPALLRGLVDQDSICLALLGWPERRFVFANAACRRMIGADIEGMPADAVFPGLTASIAAAPDRPGRIVTRLAASAQPAPGAAPWDIDHAILPGQGGRADTVLVIARQAGEPAVAVTVHADLERQVAERTQALARASADLRQRMESRSAQANDRTRGRKLETVSQLARMVGHDLFNQLTLVSGNLELLELRLTDDDALQCVRDAYDAAWRLETVARTLLGSLRGEALSPRIVDVNKLLAETGRLLAEALDERFRIRVEAAAKVWPVVSAPDALLSAVLDLVLAARVALGDGGTIILKAGNRSLDGANRPADGGVPDGAYVAIQVTATAADGGSRVVFPGRDQDGADPDTQSALEAAGDFARQAGGELRFGDDPPGDPAAVLLLPRAAVEDGPEAADAAAGDAALHGAAVLLVVESDVMLRAVVAGLLRGFG